MTTLIGVGFVVLVSSSFSQGVTSKIDFADERESISVVNNSSKENEDVEVKHTIVFSTKLKNNNRRGLHISHDDNSGTSHTFNQAAFSKREESEEVPVMKGYKAVETTKIFTPDTRQKTTYTFPNELIMRNIPDDNDVYPSIASNPIQFKPSTYYNNINWRRQDGSRNFNNFMRRKDGSNYLNSQPSSFQREITDNGVRDFYCKKCRELSRGQGIRECIQQRSNPWYNENTTPKMKIDGKLVKLN